MTVERVDKGGEIFITRNPDVIDEEGEPVFPLSDLRELILEAELHGASENACLHFLYGYNGSRVSKLFFPVEGGIIGDTGNVKARRYDAKKVDRFLAMVAVLQIIIIALFLFF